MIKTASASGPDSVRLGYRNLMHTAWIHSRYGGIYMKYDDSILGSSQNSLSISQQQADRILRLSDAFGPSGLEDEVADLIVQDLPFCKTSRDSIGNLYLVPEQMKQPDILLDSHMDEVGFMVQYVQNNGTLGFLPVGGMNPEEVYGQKVRLKNTAGQSVYAVCGTVPVHYRQAAVSGFDHLSLDIGCADRSQVLAMGVEPGCFGVPDTKARLIAENGVFLGKAFDDRIGCAALIQTMIELHQMDRLQYVMGLCTVQEEVGERGSAAAVLELHPRPKVCICFEGCPADDTFEGEDRIQSGLRRGPMIRARDKSMITHPRLLAFARNIAREKKIPLQIAVRSGGGTNGGIYHTHNIPTLVIGIPVRYAHAAVGFCTWQDYQDGVKLAVEITAALSEYFAAEGGTPDE